MEPKREKWRKPWSSLTPDVYRFLLTTFCVTLLLTRHMAATATSIQTVSGMLYAENFTYYKLSGEGWLRLELHSLQGDVDLYVSGATLSPTFADYELKSDSCGVDIVDIHSSITRPVGIGIYAHPYYLQSVFKMDIQVVKDYETDEYEQLFQAYHYYDDKNEASRDENKARSSRSARVTSDSEEEEEESIWWTILITMLKFILEVIV